MRLRQYLDAGVTINLDRKQDQIGGETWPASRKPRVRSLR